MITRSAEILRSPEFATADAWADNCRTFPSTAPRPGPWCTDDVPYTREIMRAFADPGTDVIVGLMGAQMSKTEVQLNVLGWMWDTRPRPAIYVTPTEKLARTMSRDRIARMLETAPRLMQKVDRRYDKPGSLERWIAGARFGLAWAGSATELASHPCAIVMVDERSRMDADVAGEGDPVRLAMARTKNYPHSKVGVFSTPTTEGICATWDWWLTGTKERWCWQCLHCGGWFAPDLSLASWPQDAPYEVIREETVIACPHCGGAHDDEQRRTLDARYIASTVDESGSIHLAPGLETRNPVRSFWVTGWCSPFISIGEVAEQYARAARDGGPGDMQAVVNTYCGELWREPGHFVPAEAVKACQSSEELDIQLVTAGVDVQENSLYYVVRGWGANVTSMLLAHGQLHGATEFDDVWVALATVLGETYAGLRIRRVMVDSGYNTAQVYEACRRNGWSPSKGMVRQDKPFKDSTVDESRTGRAKKTIRLWTFCSDTWKTWLYARIQWPEDQPGRWLVPPGIDDTYCAQVTNERVRTARGRRQWYTVGTAGNHLLDCEVLAAVGAHIENVRVLRPRKAPEEEPESPKPAPSKADQWVARYRRERLEDEGMPGIEGL